MSKISDKLSYPEASPIQGADYLIGTDADSSPIEKQTKTFTISDLKDFIIDGLFDGVSYRIPVFTAASAGADSEKIVSSLISQDTAQQSGSFILGTTVTIDNGSGAGSLIVADAFTPFGVSTFEGDAFFKTNATINPDANLYLLESLNSYLYQILLCRQYIAIHPLLFALWPLNYSNNPTLNSRL